MDQTVPESGEAFEAMMREIDSELSKRGTPIPGRALAAASEVSLRFKINMPLFGGVPLLPPDLQQYAQLSKNIHGWFRRQYGDRLKVDMSPGRTVTEIGGDLYVIRYPRIMGAVQFVLSRRFMDYPEISTRGPVLCNILQQVEGLTADRAAALSDDALNAIREDFELGLEALDILETSQNELIAVARGDVQEAVNHLMDRAERYGAAKWASLQAAEKTLKAAIALEGATFDRTHTLSVLCAQLDGLGIQFSWKPLADAIQCTPGIRYGDEACNRDQALSAHRASLRIVLELTKAGAKLERGLV